MQNRVDALLNLIINFEMNPVMSPPTVLNYNIKPLEQPSK